MRVYALLLLSALALPAVAQPRVERLSQTDSVSVLKVLTTREWIIQERDTLKRTTDAGLQWTVIPLPVSFKDVPLYQWDWAEDGSGVAWRCVSIGEADSVRIILAFTNDWGGRWDVDSFLVSERLPANTWYLTDVAMLRDSVFVCCLNDRVFRSTDRGRTFTHIPIERRINTLHFRGEQYGYGGDSYTGSVRTTDGGRSWENVDIATNCFYFDLRGRAFFASGSGFTIARPFSAVWDTIPLPLDANTRGLYISWNGVAVLDAQDIWVFPRMNQPLLKPLPMVNLTKDGGAHWGTESTLPVMAAERIDAEHAVILSRGVYLLTIPNQRPLQLRAVNFSSYTRPMIKLDWNDPSDGLQSGYHLERASADSIWREIAPGSRPQERFMIDTGIPESGGSTYRYRVTTFVTGGDTLTAMSDTVSIQMGRYLDPLDALVPTENEDNDLTYRYKTYDSTHTSVFYDTTVTVIYHFYPERAISEWEREIPMRQIIRGPSGEVDTLWPRFIVNTDSLRRFRFDVPIVDGYPCAYGYGNGLSVPNIFYESPHGYYYYQPYGINGMFYAPNAGYHPEDTLSIRTVGQGMNPNYFRYSCAPLDGVIIGMSGRGGYDPPHEYNRWELTLLSTSTGVHAPPPPDASIELSPVYPNPGSSFVAWNYRLPRRSSVRMTLHDMLGRKVLTMVDALQDAGRYTQRVNLQYLPPGAYLCRLTDGEHVRTQVVVRMK
jgi:hypothetical protein